jgi:DNA-binding NarL/FixJ family response regulator
MEHTVLVVEDELATRHYFEDAVRDCGGLRLVGAAGTLADGLRLLRREAPDVVLVDLGLPDGSGLELIHAARSLSADTQSLVVTVLGDERTVLTAIEAGARGYLLKDAEPGDLARSVLDLLAGGSPISPAIARHLLARFQETGPSAKAEVAGPQLTEREREVLDLVVKGLSYAEIAESLGISCNTTSTHVRHIYRKLEVRSRGEAVFEAIQRGLVTIDA